MLDGDAATKTATADEDLLRQVRAGPAAASRVAMDELVRRHVDFVYSAARRQVHGDAHLAEDVTQAVFILMSRKRPDVGPGKLAGWLYNATRLVARNAVKVESRRRKYERQAAQERSEVASMSPSTRHENSAGVAANWDEVGPLLDHAVGKLSAGERDVVLLHYFQNLTLAEAARRLGISEVAARQRSSRAVGKLRDLLAKSGVACSTGALTEAMSHRAVSPAPAGVTQASQSAAAGAPAAAGTTAAALASAGAASMAAVKIKIAVAIIAGVALAGTGVVAVIERQSVSAKPAALAVPDLSHLRTFACDSDITYPDGTVVRESIAIDMDKGVLRKTSCRGQAYVWWMAGDTTYRFRDGGDVVATSAHSPRSAADTGATIVRDFAGWTAAGATRDPSADQAVDGERLQAFQIARWRVIDGRPATVWVDAANRPRRAKAKGAQGEAIECVVAYDRPTTGATDVKFPPGARVVGEDALLEEWFPLKGAVWAKEMASHVLAIHSCTRDASGNYHLVVSARPTDAAKPMAAGSPPANFVCRADGSKSKSIAVATNCFLANVSVRDVIVAPGSGAADGVCEFDVTMLLWGDVTRALQEQHMSINGMSHVTMRPTATTQATTAGVLAEVYDAAAKRAGPAAGGVVIETRGTIPIGQAPGQVAKDKFVDAVMARLK